MGSVQPQFIYLRNLHTHFPIGQYKYSESLRDITSFSQKAPNPFPEATTLITFLGQEHKLIYCLNKNEALYMSLRL